MQPLPDIWLRNRGPYFDMERLAYFFVPCFVVEVVYFYFVESRLFSKKELEKDKPVIPFIATSIIGFISHYLWWNHRLGITPADMKQDADENTEALMYLVLAYMVADTIVLLVRPSKIYGTTAWQLFLLHHVVMLTNITATLHHRKYAHLWLFGITSEITNFFLNGKDLLPPSLRMAGDALFALAFLIYRMGYMCSLLITSLYAAFVDNWMDFLVILHGPALLVPLHFYWTYLIIIKLHKTLFAGDSKNKKEKEKEKNSDHSSSPNSSPTSSAHDIRTTNGTNTAGSAKKKEL